MTEVQSEVQPVAQETQKLANNKEIIAYLAEKFPLCFSLEGEAKPLKIGLFQDLAEALKDDERVSKTQLRQALRQYTSNWRYLHGCRAGAERVDLQGNSAGLLEEEHVLHAQQQLAEAKAKLAQQRAAQRAERAEKAKNNKKRYMRKNKGAQAGAGVEKNTALKKEAKSEAPLQAADLASLHKEARVKVKISDTVKGAVVLDIVKDGARVQLDNGLVINVSAESLFLG
ncbi:RNA chaperone ProQ [Mesocricetibacter intestinalis]|uniref:RNA chaperone ProQ n=1 Tax=Mesocricetibacter intestinalis TaxID=1521930 RepID=UPI0010622AD5|nr:RNA chaperone ProQ [Mesocricetibacter intestinalis]